MLHATSEKKNDSKPTEVFVEEYVIDTVVGSFA